MTRPKLTPPAGVLVAIDIAKARNEVLIEVPGLREVGVGAGRVFRRDDEAPVVLVEIAKPRDITIVPELPKTRSGKIMRRLLKDMAEGRDGGDTSTLSDPTIMDQIREKGTRG